MAAYELKAWSLADLYSGLENDDLKADLNKLDRVVDEVMGYREKLNDSTTVSLFREFLKKYEELITLTTRLSSFTGLLFSGYSQDPKIIAAVGKIDALWAEIQSKTVFASLWWKNLADEKAEAFLNDLPEYRSS